jgi:hypothetical protein
LSRRQDIQFLQFCKVAPYKLAIHTPFLRYQYLIHIYTKFQIPQFNQIMQFNQFKLVEIHQFNNSKHFKTTIQHISKQQLN